MDISSNSEGAFVFTSGKNQLLGILHQPDASGPPDHIAHDIAVLIVVGGPQYRVGSHRQFLLIARALAADGIATMRFDYAGMGDSDGTYLGFEFAGDDIGAAARALAERLPKVKKLILWGLCDGAAAIALHQDKLPADGPSLAGLALINPWVRTEGGAARARLKHYYLQRLMDPDFWRRVGRGEWHVGDSLSGLVSILSRAIRPKKNVASGPSDMTVEGDVPGQIVAAPPPGGTAPLPDRVLAGITGSASPVLLMLSGHDLVADEFRDTLKTSAIGATLPPSVTRHDLPDADHTFSREEWRQSVITATVQWVRSLE